MWRVTLKKYSGRIKFLWQGIVFKVYKLTYPVCISCFLYFENIFGTSRILKGDLQIQVIEGIFYALPGVRNVGF